MGKMDHPIYDDEEPTSVPVPQNTPTHYNYMQPIGSDSLTMEFKRGLDRFKKDLPRYASAFLNSEGGQVWFGVDDNGLVQGININFKQQDRYRVQTDQVLKKFKPPVLPGEFCMEFLDVLPGVEKIPASETPDFKDLKVLRLTFTPPPVLTRLYQTDTEETYIRRHQSLWKMNDSDLHEWYGQTWRDELELKPSEVEQLTKENDELRKGIREALQTPDDDKLRGSIKELHAN